MSNVAESMNHAGKNVGSTSAAVIDSAKNFDTRNLKKKVGEEVADANDNASRLLDVVSARAQAAYDGASEIVRDQTTKLRDQSKELAGKLETTVKAKPIASFLVAGTAGMLVGLGIRSIMAKRS